MTAPRVGRYVDEEKLTVTWLLAQVAASPNPAGTRVVTKLPAKITGRVLWVAGVGGPDDGDNARLRVDVQSLCPARPDSSDDVWDLARDAHDWMSALDGQTVNGQPIHRVAIATRPTWRFYSDQVDRVTASYDLDTPTYRS